MDEEAARKELGVDKTASPEAVRRAYMKQVRLHSPERDPDGFARVRAAYELLNDNAAPTLAVLPAVALASAVPGAPLEVEVGAPARGSSPRLPSSAT